MKKLENYQGQISVRFSRKKVRLLTNTINLILTININLTQMNRTNRNWIWLAIEAPIRPLINV